MKQLLIVLYFILITLTKINAQHLYYKEADSSSVLPFSDSLNRVALSTADSNSILKKQFDYILKFFPTMLVKTIHVQFKETIAIARAKPKFSSILKAPDQREYNITFSKSTRSTLDSVMISNLSFNAQVGLIAKQVAQVEDMSTGGFMDFVAWYFRQLSRKGRNKIAAAAEKKMLEIGLGYQLLALNIETTEKLNIDNWKSVKGYGSYVKYTKNASMKPYLISDFINDFPVYVSQTFK